MAGCCAISDSSIRQSVVLLDEQAHGRADRFALRAGERCRVRAEVEGLAGARKAGGCTELVDVDPEHVCEGLQGVGPGAVRVVAPHVLCCGRVG